MIQSNPPYYDITSAAQILGKEICDVLPFMYAFSGCDIVSSFFSKSKYKAWDVWQQSKQKDELSLFFSELGKEPNDITSTQIDKLEKYVLDLYNIREDTLAKGRMDRFEMSTDNDIRKLPPCKDALLQHTKRACYQAGFL